MVKLKAAEVSRSGDGNLGEDEGEDYLDRVGITHSHSCRFCASEPRIRKDRGVPLI